MAASTGLLASEREDARPLVARFVLVVDRVGLRGTMVVCLISYRFFEIVGSLRPPLSSGLYLTAPGSVPHTAGTGCCQRVEDAGC